MTFRNKHVVFLAVFFLACLGLAAQEDERIKETFMSTRVVNAHSVETIRHKYLDFRVTHRFGDIGGANGGVSNFFGLDEATDIRIGFEYGLLQNLSIGVARNKGAYIPELVEGYAKYRLFTQSREKVPVSLVLLSTTSISITEASSAQVSEISFDNNVQRLSFANELLIARKFSERFSLQLIGSHVHRNLVAADDLNDVFAVGAGVRVRFSKVLAFVGDYHYVVNNGRSVRHQVPLNPIGVALELETGGHIFQIMFTNNRGIISTEYIPYTFADFTLGEFRFGFNISRIFKLFGP